MIDDEEEGYIANALLVSLSSVMYPRSCWHEDIFHCILGNSRLGLCWIIRTKIRALNDN